MKLSNYLFVLLLLCSINNASYGSQEEENILMDPMLPKTIDDLEDSDRSNEFFLSAIINDEDTKHCVINGKILSMGDRIDRCFVVRITKNQVVLIDDGIKAIKLTFY